SAWCSRGCTAKRAGKASTIIRQIHPSSATWDSNVRLRRCPLARRPHDFPAALLVVAVVFDFAAATTKRESLMWAAIWTLWAGVIGGWVAVVAGKIASGSIEHGEAIHEIMEKHENMALITMSLFTVVLGWRLIRRFQMPAQELALTRMLSVIGIAGLVWTGILGGRLVFEHAAGIPSRTLQAEIENREE